jgi:CRP-like cAMP-binding protein
VGGDDLQDVRVLVRRYRAEWAPSSFLMRLPPELLEKLLDVAELMLFRTSEILIEEGKDDTDVYLLLSSCVKVTADLGGGRSALLAVRVGGDLVGELAASGTGRRIASVVACGREPAVAARVGAADFVRLASEYPQALVLLSEAVGRKLSTATRRRVDYSGHSPLVRLARVLVELADDHGRPLVGDSVLIALDLTQIELGTLIGVGESSVLRALRALKERGLVDTHGRRTVVRSLQSLRAVAS